MLATKLPHITTDEQYQQVLADNEKVMICCGRNGPMCLPVYDAMETLDGSREDVKFMVMPFDHPVSNNIRSLPQVRGFMGLPFTLYYKNGKVVKATSSVQSKAQVEAILNGELAE
jgi:thioredoxin 1